MPAFYKERKCLLQKAGIYFIVAVKNQEGRGLPDWLILPQALASECWLKSVASLYRAPHPEVTSLAKSGFVRSCQIVA